MTQEFTFKAVLFTLFWRKVDEKSCYENLKVIKNTFQINQEILKASKNSHNSLKALQLMCSRLARIC